MDEIRRVINGAAGSVIFPSALIKPPPAGAGQWDVYFRRQMFVVTVKRLWRQEEETKQKVICHKWAVLWTNQQGVQVSTPVSITNVRAFGIKAAVINPPLQFCIPAIKADFSLKNGVSGILENAE